MSKPIARLAGACMTIVAILVFLALHGVVVPTPVQASACCQLCEAQQAACYAACDANSHNNGADDSLNACYDGCDNDTPTASCWRYCTVCQPKPTSPCYAYNQWDTVYWHLDGEGMMVVDQVVHFFQMNEVGSGWCP